MSTQYVYYEVNMLLTCILTLFFQLLLLEFRPIISCYVMCHVTIFTSLSKKNKSKKKEILNQKIDKKKKKKT